MSDMKKVMKLHTDKAILAILDIFNKFTLLNNMTHGRMVIKIFIAFNAFSGFEKTDKHST